MKISTKGRYALRLMIDLAIYGEEKPVSINDVSVREGISGKYLEQIIASLKKAEYVKSVRGAQGGYQLTKAPAEYTVGMILYLTEGSLAPVACLEEKVNTCHKKEGCAALRLWGMLDEAIKGVIDTVTLADLVKWRKEAGEGCVQ